MRFLMNDQNIIFGYTTPKEKLETMKEDNKLTLMNV